MNHIMGFTFCYSAVVPNCLLYHLNRLLLGKQKFPYYSCCIVFLFTFFVYGYCAKSQHTHTHTHTLTHNMTHYHIEGVIHSSGYLTVSLCLQEGNELSMLLVNTLQKVPTIFCVHRLHVGHASCHISDYIENYNHIPVICFCGICDDACNHLRNG